MMPRRPFAREVRTVSEPGEYNRLQAPVNQIMIHEVDEWLRKARRWCLPTHCVLCGAAGEANADLCSACRADLPSIRGACPACALPLATPGICGRCQRFPRPFDGAVAAFLYQPPLDGLIKQLKFGGRLALARLLGELMAERWLAASAAMPKADIIVPVPLHSARLRERGFNQAVELSRIFSRLWEVPLDEQCVERVRATAPQSDLPAKLRRQNVKGAFRVRGVVTGRHVAVVDDVMTSGHTVSELAAGLRRAGAASVSVWVGARVVL